MRFSTASRVRNHQLGGHGFRVPDRVHGPIDVRDLAVEAAQHVQNRVRLPDIGQELVPQPFALGCAPRTRPAISTTSNCVGSTFALWAISAISDPSRGSGTATRPVFGSMVQKRVVRRFRRGRLGQTR